MVMEVGAPLGSTKWTSTVPWPFAPAPGAARLGEMHTSGFAVTAPGADEGITFSDDPVTAWETPFTARREPVAAGEIPSMVVRFRFTDRGTLTKERLDAGVADFLKKAGYKVSRATSFKSVAVTWRWQRSGPGSEFYFPVIATPADLAGLRYGGGQVAERTFYEPTDAELAKMPNQIYIYTVATTSAHNTMSDGEAAVVITLLKQAMNNMNMLAAGAAATVETIVRGCPPAVFQKPAKPPLPPVVVKAGWSALILVVAYNMIAPHIGSEVL